MNDQQKLRMIKTVCWIGVAADAFWALALVWPALFTFLTGEASLNDDLTLRLIAGTAASLMAGWTVLLAWTARKPVERRAVLAFTAFPVVAGLFCVTLIGFITRQNQSGWILFKTAGICAAMLWAFSTAKTLAKESPDENRD